MASSVVCRIVVPETADTYIEEGLRRLTRHLEKAGAPVGGGCLGGRWGYGADFENEVFAMHRYCWCEREDCPWCGGCQCPPEADEYFIDGKRVSHEEYTALFKRLVGDVALDDPRFERRWREVRRRMLHKHKPMCDFCLGTGIFGKHGAEPGKPAPNFWHKSSDVKIWWYKWIGRDMEYNRVPSEKEWDDIMRRCMESIAPDRLRVQSNLRKETKQ